MPSSQRTKPLFARGGLVACVPSVAVLVGLSACGGRDVPDTWPDNSAASPAAQPAPPAVVTQALEGPPPLPGERATGWAGLQAPADTPAHEHAGHGGAHPSRAGGQQSGHEPAGEAVRYVCPMHPDVVADEPGTCPRCGMALVKRDVPE